MLARKRGQDGRIEGDESQADNLVSDRSTRTSQDSALFGSTNQRPSNFLDMSPLVRIVAALDHLGFPLFFKKKKRTKIKKTVTHSHSGRFRFLFLWLIYIYTELLNFTALYCLGFIWSHVIQPSVKIQLIKLSIFIFEIELRSSLLFQSSPNRLSIRSLRKKKVLNLHLLWQLK